MSPTFWKMLADRSYMRSDYPRRRTSALVWIVAITLAAFVVELVAGSPWFNGNSLLAQLSLNIPALQQWHLWTLVSHALLHSMDTPFHILFTVLSLVFVGRELEPQLGAKRFATVYVSAIVLGAAAWTAVHWAQGGVHIGAGAGVFGLFVVLALLHPHQEINFLVFFLFPVRLRPIYLLYGLLVIDAFALLFYEVRGGSYAASAHLGGMLAGWLYYRFFHASNGMDRATGFQLRLPAWLRRAKKPAPARAPVVVGLARPGQSATSLRAEVDRILDKINSEGFGALTEQEKRLLDDAKDMLSRN